MGAVTQSTWTQTDKRQSYHNIDYKRSSGELQVPFGCILSVMNISNGSSTEAEFTIEFSLDCEIRRLTDCYQR